MILCHESNVFNKPPLAIYNTCYCYSQVSRTKICVTRPRMSHRTKSVKRPRSESSRSKPAGGHHQGRDGHVRQGPGPSTSRSQDRAGRQGAGHQPQAQQQPHGSVIQKSRAGASSASTRPGTAPRTHINPKVFQPHSGDLARVTQETSEARHRDKVCTYCTTYNKEVRHHHFSTEKL